MTSATLRGGLALAVAGLAFVGAAHEPPKPAQPDPIAPLDVAHLLETYAAGRFDEAVAGVARAGDQVGCNLRSRWTVDAPTWTDGDLDRRQARLLVAAALALETVCVRVERGQWSVQGDPPCSGPSVLDWAERQLVARGLQDRAERAWFLAAAALAAGVRDWDYLYRPALAQGQSGDGRPPRGLMARALARFPGDPDLRLEQAIAAAGRFTITTDGGRYAYDGSLPSIAVVRGGLTVSGLHPRETAVEMLDALVSDPVVGAEAGVRLGYLHWVLGHDTAAETALTEAARRTGDPDLRYLAGFLLGWTALVRRDVDTAIPHLRAALESRPDSQSAALALASLLLQRGDAHAAHDVAQASLDNRPQDDDPWRLFLYGHYARLPALVAELRELVRS